MTQRRLRGKRGLPVVVASLLLLGACSTGSGEDKDPSTAAPAASGGPHDLRGVCPSTLVFQTAWLPNIESFGAVYSLLGPNPKVDNGKKRVTAPLTARGKDTGVQLELRAGGPAVGYIQSTAQLYTDPSITFAVPSGFDEVIQLSKTQPTLAVLALVDIDPQMIMWDSQKYPDFHTIVDIGQTETKVLYFGGDTYMEYLTGSGILQKSQVDGSFDGSPARFVAERGEIAQSGYATGEPYIFEKETKQWAKPIKFQLIYDTGYPNYGPSVTIRTKDKDKLAPCLKKLMPIIQQAQVDLLAKPDPVIALTVKLNEEYKTGVPYSMGVANFAAGQVKRLGLTGNGAPADGVVGNYNESRVQRLIDIVEPIFAAQSKPIKDGLKPSDVVTNEFLGQIGVK